MAEYVSAALFVYGEESADLVGLLENNPFGVDVRAVSIVEFQDDPEAVLDGCSHVVVSGAMAVIRAVLELAIQFELGVGIVPLASQRELVRTYALPSNTDNAIDLALRTEPYPVSLLRCNGIVVIHRALVGRLPLLDASQDAGRWGTVVEAAKRFVGLRLLPFQFVAAGDKKVRTAACGCLVVPHLTGNRAVRRILRFVRVGDGSVNVIVSSPSSIVRYLQFLWRVLVSFARQPRSLPPGLGQIKSSSVDISSDTELWVDIDRDATSPLPARFEALPDALGINVGDRFREDAEAVKPPGERIDVRDLPKGKEELAKACKKTIPFFPYASEDRFRDLFMALRDDAAINTQYLSLMVLSTTLATIGLYQDSAAVVIGAMLLAPLMAPIISFSMGVVRQDSNLSKRSVRKIAVGIVIALGAAAFITLVFPYKPLTGEMEGRLHPSLLDLGVAIVAGVAGAYTKAYREILQSLAGVAIAVALVPPLAVAGIGLGRLDPDFFAQAFLLFSTNLVGITLAAALTFRVLGYAPAVRDKRSMSAVVLTLVLIAVPLYLSFSQIVEDSLLEKAWQKERFLVNGKYLIVQSARLSRQNGKEVLSVDLLAREVITRGDLTAFRKKMEANFARKLRVNASIIYIP
jgi:uncharacterized hydrophobic protein (TIGR00271 family)